MVTLDKLRLSVRLGMVAAAVEMGESRGADTAVDSPSLL